jgi:hypothetical protein
LQAASKKRVTGKRGFISSLVRGSAAFDLDRG